MKGLKNYFDSGIVWVGDKLIPAKYISTGIPSLNEITGGGFPIGHITEVYGTEAVGKTTLALKGIAEAQKQGKAAYIDLEHSLNPAWMKKCGVDIDSLIFAQPEYGEQAFEIVNKLIPQVSMVVIDSVAAVVPKAEIEGEIGDSHIGLQARLMSQMLRMLTATIASSECAVVFINQLRMKVVMFGNPETTSGGVALKYYSTLRIDLRRSDLIKSKEVIGIKVKAKTVKNKLFPPFKETIFDILF